MSKPILKNFQRHKLDSGSPESQIALLTQRISSLTMHLKINKKDFSARKGLLQLLTRRKKLLQYLLKVNKNTYYSLIFKLNIRPLKES